MALALCSDLAEGMLRIWDPRSISCFCPPATLLHRVHHAYWRAAPFLPARRTLTSTPTGPSPDRFRPPWCGMRVEAIRLVGHSERRTLFGETDESRGRQVRRRIGRRNYADPVRRGNPRPSGKPGDTETDRGAGR